MKRRSGIAYQTSNSRARHRRSMRRACAACAGALMWGTAPAIALAYAADDSIPAFVAPEQRSIDSSAAAATLKNQRFRFNPAPLDRNSPGEPAATGPASADYARKPRPRTDAANPRQSSDFTPDNPTVRVGPGGLQEPLPLAMLGRGWAELIAARLERVKAPKD